MTRSGAFLTSFEVFGNVAKNSLECLIIFSIETKTKGKTEKENRKNLCDLRSDI